VRKTWILAATAAASLVLAGCTSGGSDSSSSEAGSPPPAPSSSSASSSSPASSDVLKTASTSLGTIVVDAQGLSVYYFDKDVAGSGKSTCSGQCLQDWPAVVADSSSPQVNGVTGKVGTIKRDDGTIQVTLNGLPLYLFIGDKKPGDVTGQAVDKVWWVVAPDGKKITTPPPAASPSGLVRPGDPALDAPSY
jgi:predicted lipoprotein with Yx(FWY)xxD motif